MACLIPKVSASLFSWKNRYGHHITGGGLDLRAAHLCPLFPAFCQSLLRALSDSMLVFLSGFLTIRTIFHVQVITLDFVFSDCLSMHSAIWKLSSRFLLSFLFLFLHRSSETDDFFPRISVRPSPCFLSPRLTSPYRLKIKVWNSFFFYILNHLSFWPFIRRGRSPIKSFWQWINLQAEQEETVVLGLRHHLRKYSKMHVFEIFNCGKSLLSSENSSFNSNQAEKRWQRNKKVTLSSF